MIADKRLGAPSREVSGPAVASTATITTGTPPYKSEWRSSKTRPRHLEREAIVYVRQSTPQQIVEHGESLSRQYALPDRAAALGWPPPNVLLIDDDLGLADAARMTATGFSGYWPTWRRIAWASYWPWNGQLAWRLATVTIVSTALHHPLYAGAYSWGRRQTQTHIDVTGRVTQSRRQRVPGEWAVLLYDRVPAYITWDQYLANQRQLWENQRRPATKGTPGGGSAMLTGLVYCGRCGRKMYVSYESIRHGRYCCSRPRFAPTDEVCSGLPAQSLDELVSRQVLQPLSSAGIELSLSAIEHTSQQRRQQGTQRQQNLDPPQAGNVDTSPMA
jgi:Recombinase zinc beta ribbon domain/Recombinase